MKAKLLKRLRREARKKYRLAERNGYYQAQEFNYLYKKWFFKHPGCEFLMTGRTLKEYVDELRRSYILSENSRIRYENKKPEVIKWKRVY